MSTSNQNYYLKINTFEDVLIARKRARDLMEEHRFTTLDQTKFITAISELLRNVLIHAGNGDFNLSVLDNLDKFGIRCIISDQGPGIKDLDRAMVEGYSTVGSLGLGLGGAKKLSDDFHISSKINEGTTVSIIKWR